MLDAEQVAEEQAGHALRRGVGQRQERARPERGGDDDRDGQLGAEPPLARGEGDEHRGRQHAAGRAEQERQPGDRGQRQPRQHRVGERLRRVRLAVGEQPHAERPARQAEEHRLEQGAREDGHAWSWPQCWTLTARSPPGRTTSSWPYVASSTSGTRTPSVGP